MAPVRRGATQVVARHGGVPVPASACTPWPARTPGVPRLTIRRRQWPQSTPAYSSAWSVHSVRVMPSTVARMSGSVSRHPMAPHPAAPTASVAVWPAMRTCSSTSVGSSDTAAVRRLSMNGTRVGRGCPSGGMSVDNRETVTLIPSLAVVSGVERSSKPLHLTPPPLWWFSSIIELRVSL